MPKLSWMTLAKGARQLVVQEALLRKREEGSISQRQHIYKGEMRPHTTSESSRPESIFLSPYLTIFRDLSYLSWLTPITNMGASAEGAEMITRLAPPFR